MCVYQRLCLMYLIPVYNKVFIDGYDGLLINPKRLAPIYQFSVIYMR